MQKALNITQPTLLLHKERAILNIQRMAHKAQRSGVRLRPHFKTHQSAEIGEWFRPYGVDAITVTSVEMATYFADHGWRDITIAFPLNWLQIDAIDELAQRIELNLMVESQETARFVRRNLRSRAKVWLDVDTGYRRTGVAWDDLQAILAIAETIADAPQLTVCGLLTHAGHSYQAGSTAEVLQVHQDTVDKLTEVRGQLQARGFSALEISVGDTPCCSLVDDLSPVNEIRPGNFVFYDAMQLQVGSCREEDIAVAVACPVVAKYPARDEIVIYGGAVHLSKDYIVGDRGEQIFGLVAPYTGVGWGRSWKNAYVSRLAQEVGTIKASQSTLDQVNVGDCVAVLPAHSCLTVNLLRRYVTLEGEIIPLADYTI